MQEWQKKSLDVHQSAKMQSVVDGVIVLAIMFALGSWIKFFLENMICLLSCLLPMQ